MFIRQICEGLRYMHKMHILHLDLKVKQQLKPWKYEYNVSSYCEFIANLFPRFKITAVTLPHFVCLCSAAREHFVRQQINQ